MSKSGIAKIGNWDSVEDMTKHLGVDIQRINRRSLKRAGLRAERMAVEYMRNPLKGWAPLNPKYVARKVAAGGSEKMLINTSTYFQSITSVQYLDDAFAGVFKQARYKGGESVADVARVLEYGSYVRNIPPRPLWQHVYARTKNWIFREQYFIKEVLNYLEQKYGAKRG